MTKANAPAAAPLRAPATEVPAAGVAHDGTQHTPVDTALPSPSVLVDENATGDGARTTVLQRPADVAGALNGSAALTHGAADSVEAPGIIAIAGATKLLAMHIGPFARIVSRNLQSELGISGSELTKLQYHGFVTKMAAQVTDESKKETFISNAAEFGVPLT